jgi:hypothetical protein
LSELAISGDSASQLVAPFFETASEKYPWLNRLLAIGFGRQTRDQVGYRGYAVL